MAGEAVDLGSLLWGTRQCIGLLALVSGGLYRFICKLEN